MTSRKNRELSQRDFSQKEFSQSELSLNDFSQSNTNIYSSTNNNKEKKSKFKIRSFFNIGNHDNERSIPRDGGVKEKRFVQLAKRKDKNRNKPLPVINEKMRSEAIIEHEGSFSQSYFVNDQSQMVNEDVKFFSQNDENSNPNLGSHLYHNKKSSNSKIKNGNGLRKFENFIDNDLPKGNDTNVNKIKTPGLIKSIVSHEDNFTDTSTAVSSNILNGNTYLSVSTTTTENSNMLNGSTLVNGNNINMGYNSTKDGNVNFFLDKSVFEDPISNKEPPKAINMNNTTTQIKSYTDLTNYSQYNFAETSFIDNTIFSNNNINNTLVDNSATRTNKNSVENLKMKYSNEKFEEGNAKNSINNTEASKQQ